MCVVVVLTAFGWLFEHVFFVIEASVFNIKSTILGFCFRIFRHHQSTLPSAGRFLWYIACYGASNNHLPCRAIAEVRREPPASTPAAAGKLFQARTEGGEQVRAYHAKPKISPPLPPWERLFAGLVYGHRRKTQSPSDTSMARSREDAACHGRD